MVALIAASTSILMYTSWRLPELCTGTCCARALGMSVDRQCSSRCTRPVDSTLLLPLPQLLWMYLLLLLCGLSTRSWLRRTMVYCCTALLGYVAHGAVHVCLATGGSRARTLQGL